MLFEIHDIILHRLWRSLRSATIAVGFTKFSYTWLGSTIWGALRTMRDTSKRWYFNHKRDGENMARFSQHRLWDDEHCGHEDMELMQLDAAAFQQIWQINKVEAKNVSSISLWRQTGQYGLFGQKWGAH